MIRTSSNIAELLRELLQKHGKQLNPSQDPLQQLIDLSQAINREWRDIHQQPEAPRILFLRAELNAPGRFEIFYVDGHERRASIPRSSLYEIHPAS